jgi:hypothetical protein
MVRILSNCVPENVTIVVEIHVYSEQLDVFRDGGSHVPSTWISTTMVTFSGTQFERILTNGGNSVVMQYTLLS